MTLKAAKAGFFDRGRVKKSMDQATRRVLSRFGAFVRQRAKSSIRKRKGTSPPGKPPYSHTGLLRKFILFAYDPRARSVVIGPVLLRVGSDVPIVLEHGGTATRRGRRGSRRVRYPARPFMRPAFDAEQGSLPKLWRNSVR